MASAVLLIIFGCKGKPSLSSDDARYVRTTLSLIRLRGSLTPTSDTIETKRRLDSLYKDFGTSKDKYLAESKSIGGDAARAGMVYTAIRDSLGVK
ncbi:MAG: hypothetical protein Q8922_15665 [Bacteroidota bacterium]|nr:hypothetical protein [Bacteroidota bacterium]